MEKNINYEKLLNTLINAEKEIISLKMILMILKVNIRCLKYTLVLLKILMIGLEKSHYQLVLNLCDLAMKLYYNEINFMFSRKESIFLKMAHY